MIGHSTSDVIRRSGSFGLGYQTGGETWERSQKEEEKVEEGERESKYKRRKAMTGKEICHTKIMKGKT